MCGIHALIGDTSCLEKMVESTSYRGPDSTGLWREGSNGLGHNRLSIVDLSPAGEQPMWNADKTIGIVYNGEVYNHKALRSRVSEYVFQSTSDTETLLALYASEGIHFVDHLWGMYAFVILDRRQNRLFAVRDPDGMKPLMYAEQNGAWVFASELKSLFQRFAPRSIDIESLRWYLSVGFVPAPKTFYQGYSSLQAGEILEIDLKTGHVSRDQVHRLFATTHQDFSEVLCSSLNRHLLSDVPVGIFLSGGLDSSVLATGLVRELNVRPEAFHVSIPGRDDTARALHISKELGLNLHQINWSEKDAHDYFEQAISVLSQPLADIAFLPLLKVSALASETVKVVLSGDGADELFYGYGRHKHLLGRSVHASSALHLKTIARLPRRVRAALSRFSGDACISYLDSIRLSDDGGLPSESSIQALIQGRQLKYGEDLDRNIYLPDDLLPKTDLAGMSVGLEGRLPFLDPEMQVYADALPVPQKWGLEGSKLPLRKYLRDQGFASLAAQGKQGFGIPVRALIAANRSSIERSLGQFLLRAEVQEAVGYKRYSAQYLVKERPVMAYACSLAERIITKYGL